MHRLAEFVAPSRLGRNFRWLLASSWVTNLGDGITLAAGPLLVASQTRDPLAVAMAAFLQRLPWLFFGVYAGVVADRLDRRAIVITTGFVRIAILLLLGPPPPRQRPDGSMARSLRPAPGSFSPNGSVLRPPRSRHQPARKSQGAAPPTRFSGVITGQQFARMAGSVEPSDLEDDYAFAAYVGEVGEHEPASGLCLQARTRTVVVPSVRIDHGVVHRDFASKQVKFRTRLRREVVK